MNFISENGKSRKLPYFKVEDANKNERIEAINLLKTK